MYMSCPSNCSDNPISVTIYETANGIKASPYGGEPPYTYRWSDGSTTQEIINPAPGLWTVTVSYVIDNNICEAVDDIQVNADSAACGNGITDSQGNTYSSVTIGSQCWLTENLKNDMGLATTTDSMDWASIHSGATQTPALCCFMNLLGYINDYGYLYNYFALTQPGLCPDGWHVPSLQEWQELITYLGGETVAGGKLKIPGTDYWNSPNLGASNSAGFFARAGGLRYQDAIFYGLGEEANFATSTQDSTGSYFSTIRLDTYTELAEVVENYKNTGVSCRCIKD
jgi:uncharacterized protein (TIGR02145 family)